MTEIDWKPSKAQLGDNPDVRLLQKSDERGNSTFRVDHTATSLAELSEVENKYANGDLQGIQELANSKGVFREEDKEYNKTSTLSRSEFLFSIWKSLGCPEAGDLGEGEIQSLNGLCGVESYYRPAVAFLLGANEGKDSFTGMYNWRDIEEPITWLEVAYLLYEVFGLEHTIDWNQKNPKLRLTILRDVASGNVITSIQEYKGSELVGDYLGSMRSGKRGIPLPFLSAFRDLGNRGWGLVVEEGDGNLFKEVSRAEAIKVLTNLQG